MIALISIFFLVFIAMLGLQIMNIVEDRDSWQSSIFSSFTDNPSSFFGNKDDQKKIEYSSRWLYKALQRTFYYYLGSIYNIGRTLVILALMTFTAAIIIEIYPTSVYLLTLISLLLFIPLANIASKYILRSKILYILTILSILAYVVFAFPAKRYMNSKLTVNTKLEKAIKQYEDKIARLEAESKMVESLIDKNNVSLDSIQYLKDSIQSSMLDTTEVVDLEASILDFFNKYTASIDSTDTDNSMDIQSPLDTSSLNNLYNYDQILQIATDSIRSDSIN